MPPAISFSWQMLIEILYPYHPSNFQDNCCAVRIWCDSKTLRRRLRDAGTDLIVRRPVHPAALRLLILHSLYRGPEKRRTNRVSVGATIQYPCKIATLSANSGHQ